MLILCNIVLMLIVVLFTVLYSRSAKASQEQIMLDNLCNTVETMKQMPVRYLSGELEAAGNWAAYIEQEHMSMDEAPAYIRSISDQTDCEAHLVDMDTFEAWGTNPVAGSNTVGIYREYFEDGGEQNDYIVRMQKMYNGEKYVLGKYKTRETQRMLISVGLRVMLRQPDGTDRGYLLLRAVPIDAMKKLWLFPVNYPAAEIGLIDQRGWRAVTPTTASIVISLFTSILP